MESFATRKMPFKFNAGGEGKSEESGVVEASEPSNEAAEYTPDELGSVLAEAIKSGSGDAVYEAVASIVANCK